MQRVKISSIAQSFKVDASAVRSALKVCGRPVFGGYCFLGDELINLELYEEMNLAQQMHLAQQQRRESPAQR